MTFVYEPISPADLERIDIAKISREYHMRISTPDMWVIDRELDAFLIWGYPDREPPHPDTYFFGWGKRIWGIETLSTNGPRDDRGRLTIVVTVRYIAGTDFDNEVKVNPDFADHVKDALRAFRQGMADCAPWGNQIAPVIFQRLETLQDYYHDNNRRAG